MDDHIVRANGVDLCLETFGEAGAPPLLLIGSTMLTWSDAVCVRLAAGPRFVIRYDLRDAGRSITGDPDAPAYTLRDLVGDAAALLDALRVPRAHVAGFATGGFIAQLLALDDPGRVASLTLIATRPTAPGPNDPDLPEHAPEVMARLVHEPQPDWLDRDAVVEYMAAAARLLGGSGGVDDATVRERVGRIHHRAEAAHAGTASERRAAIHRANQLGTPFAAMDCAPRWRERLGAIVAPTLVVHGEEDPFFPIGNGRALARVIPGATLLGLAGAGRELPPGAWDQVASAILSNTTSA